VASDDVSVAAAFDRASSPMGGLRVRTGCDEHAAELRRDSANSIWVRFSSTIRSVRFLAGRYEK
jgi:hypothetical protein